MAEKRPQLTRAQRVLLAQAEQGAVRVSSGYPPARRLERLGLLEWVRLDQSQPGEDVPGASPFRERATGVSEYQITDAGRRERIALREAYEARRPYAAPAVLLDVELCPACAALVATKLRA